MFSLGTRMTVSAIYLGHKIEPMELDNGESVIVVTFEQAACEVRRDEFDALERLGYIAITEAGVELTFSGRMSALQWCKQLFTKRDGVYGWQREMEREKKINTNRRRS